MPRVRPSFAALVPCDWGDSRGPLLPSAKPQPLSPNLGGVEASKSRFQRYNVSAGVASLGKPSQLKLSHYERY